MSITSMISESEILAEIVGAESGDLSPAVARAVMEWKFTAATTRRITRLAQRNQAGTITAREREALERYLRVGSLVNLVQAKARLSLKPLNRDGAHSEKRSR